LARATALALGFVVVTAVTYLRRPAPPAEPLRFTLLPPAGLVFGEQAADRVPSFAISPNGRQLVFVATAQSGQRSLWVQTIGSLTAGPLVGTEGVDSEAFPFWSPDSTHVAFFAAGKLKKVHVSGGATVTLADAPTGQGGTWNRDGVILFVPALRSVLFRVSDAGGTPTPVTTIHQELGHQGHVFPQFLADGRQFLYLVRGPQPQGGVYLASLDREETKLLLPARLKAMYAPPGYLLFLRDARLMALAFDPRLRETSGEPVAIAESVAFSSTNGRAAYTVSDSGVLAFRTAGILATSQMVWTDRLGKTVASVGPPGDYVTPRLSPDESRLAVESHDLNTGTGDLWVFDLRRGTSTRYTTDGSHNNNPVWSPNSAAIVYASREGAVVNLHLKSTSGSEPAEALLPPGPNRVPTDWSLDGQHILYEENDAGTRFNLRVLRMPGREPLPYLETPFNERDGHFSPDGRWVAYVSDESGADEVYVRPFPLSSGKWPISNRGGQMPRWRADGKELFYRAGNIIMAAPVRTGPPFDVGRPQAVFTGSFREYSVSRDGHQFLLNPETPATPVAVAPPISIVLNWQEELKRLVPVR
jgi:Tol biopolymer transport system component